MQQSSEQLLEHVIAAIMAPQRDASKLIETLRATVPDVPTRAVIRALLSADEVIRETFNGDALGRRDAQLARATALNLAILVDDYETANTITSTPLRDLPI